MAPQISFTKYENEGLPDFRKKINLAESTEDVINCFSQTITELCNTIFEKKIDFDYEDITLVLDHEPHYSMNQRFFGSDEFAAIWNDSDLSRVIARFAKTAMNRYKRLEKYSEKTDTKIRK
jgi:hypothetical protein